jgi:hypothetical protein
VQSGAGVVNWVRIPDPRLSAGGKERLGRRCAYAWGGAARREKSASDAMLRAHDAAGGREGALKVVAALTLSMRHTLEFAVLGVCRVVTSVECARGKPVGRRAAAACLLGVRRKASTAVSSD